MKTLWSCGALFSGAGGLCSGFQNAGFQTAWATDIEPDARLVYCSNFPQTDFILSDIRYLDHRRLSPVDVIHAGFPCNSFSQAGDRKGFDDPRGESCLIMLEVLSHLKEKPKILLFENSPFLLSGEDGRWFSRIEREIQDLGYFFSRQNVINFCPHRDLGQPQSRERIFMFAANKDYFSWNPFRQLEFEALPVDIKTIIAWDQAVDDAYYLTEDNPYAMRLNKLFDSHEEYSVIQWRRDKARPQRYGKVPTLTANMGSGGHNVPFIRTSQGIRKLTVEEVANLQGFRRNFFDCCDNRNKSYRMIGNAVHVDVATVVASNIKNTLVKEQSDNVKQLVLATK